MGKLSSITNMWTNRVLWWLGDEINRPSGLQAAAGYKYGCHDRHGSDFRQEIIVCNHVSDF